MDKHIFDVDGNYLGKWSTGVTVDETDVIVEIDIVDGQFHKPMLINGEVVEGLTQEEIEAIVNAPVPKTDLELLKEENERLKVSIYEMTTYAASQDEQITRQNQAILELTTLIAGGNA